MYFLLNNRNFAVSHGTVVQLVGGFNPSENVSHIGNLPQMGVKIKTLWNHHLVNCWSFNFPQLHLYVSGDRTASRCHESSLEKSMMNLEGWVMQRQGVPFIRRWPVASGYDGIPKSCVYLNYIVSLARTLGILQTNLQCESEIHFICIEETVCPVLFEQLSTTFWYQVLFPTTTCDM